MDANKAQRSGGRGAWPWVLKFIRVHSRPFAVKNLDLKCSLASCRFFFEAIVSSRPPSVVPPRRTEDGSSPTMPN